MHREAVRLLSIITVTRNDLAGLKRTLGSISLTPGAEYGCEIIVIDGASTDGTREYLEEREDERLHWISERDAGIYDAMNKGLSLARGNAVWFLNGGDVVSEGKLPARLWAPCRLQVLYHTRTGKAVYQRGRHVLFLGMPYCHQGLIFRAASARYDTRYEISADYDYLLQQGWKGLPPLERALTVFYEKSGVSEKRIIKRDLEILRIVWRRLGGLKAALAFIYLLPRNIMKHLLRRHA
jgi:glycosyltransferase involved in cell wall biosynthesis